MRLFTVEEVRALIPEVRRRAEELIPLRAELAAATAALRRGQRSLLPEAKALEARIAEILDGLAAEGIQIKGYAPLLLDFPAQVGPRRVLLCWLEGEAELGWWHDPEHGFAGRRPLDELR